MNISTRLYQFNSFAWLPKNWPRLLVVIATPLFVTGCSLFGTQAETSFKPDSGSAVSSGKEYSVQQTAHTEEKEGISFSDLAPQNIPGTIRKLRSGSSSDESLAREQFDKANAIYEQASKNPGDDAKASFVRAAKLFRSAADAFPKSSVEQDGLFMAGEALFFSDNYDRANETYELLLKKYPNSRLLDRVESRRLAIAQYWEQLAEAKPDSFFTVNYSDKRRPLRDTRGHALRVYNRIRLDDPHGKYAETATMALANAHFRNGDYIEADTAYTDLRTTFPDSEHQFDAHFLGIKTKLLIYQGPSYSSAPLAEAEKLAKQVQRFFPGEVRENYEAHQKSLAEIRRHKAQREMMVAKYYDTRGENRAARYHYGILARDYGDTPIGEKASTRLAQLGGKPDKPPQRLGWLVALLPEDEDVKPLLAPDPNSTLKR